MSDRIAVCSTADLPQEERVIVEVDDREIGVFHVGDRYYALENDCCHRGGPLCEGKLSREIVAEYNGPGMRVTERFSDTPTIACPWHGYEYELETGKHIGAGDPVVNTYDVTVDDDTVYLELTD